MPAPPSELVRALGNRSQTYSRLELWGPSLKDAEAALALEPAAVTSKNRYRRAVALVCLGRLQDAREASSELLEALRAGGDDPSPSSSVQGLLANATELASDVERALSEAEGRFDYAALLKSAPAGARWPLPAPSRLA